jgi:quercetin dioxygenase-like cupin family protein
MRKWIALLASSVLLAAPALAAPHDHAVPATVRQAIPNIPGKSLVAVEVVLPPGAVSPPHRHAKSAFILAYVVSGTIRSQVEGEPARDYHAGESWFEAPGAHHIQGQNMSKTEPAKMLAVFVVDSDEKQLTVMDK